MLLVSLLFLNRLRAQDTRFVGGQKLADPKKLDIRCRGLEDYSISVEYNIDAGGGWIKAKHGLFTVGIDLGPMIGQRVPEQGRTGLTHLQVEHIGNATMRYAVDEKKQELLATIIGAPIGSGLGIQNPNNIRIIKEQSRVPVIVDAGVGTASDACVAMELGAAGVLMNTGIAGASDPVRMARAMRDAVRAGRDAYLAGRIPKKRYATASSPVQGVIGS
jgi:hypothetical protein